MLKRFLNDIPAEATSQNPLLRYEITRHAAPATAGARVLRISGWVMGLVLLVLPVWGLPAAAQDDDPDGVPEITVSISPISSPGSRLRGRLASPSLRPWSAGPARRCMVWYG